MADIIDELQARADLCDRDTLSLRAQPSDIKRRAIKEIKTLREQVLVLERQAAEEVERLRSEVSRLERKLALPTRESPPNVWCNDSKLPE